jgi:hypothetical protein
MANDWFVCEACGAERGCDCHAKATRKSVRDAIVAALKKKPDATGASIAKQIGSTTNKTVEAVRSALVANKEIPNKPDRTEASGRKARGRKPGKSTSAPKPHYKEAAIVAALDQGLTQAEIAKETGVGQRQVRHVVEREKVKRQAQANPNVDAATLSMTAQQRLDAAIRQHKRELDIEYEVRMRAEIQKHLREVVLPSWEEKVEHAERVLKSNRWGVFSRDEYRMILSCLHPDSRGSVSDKRLREAFEAFKAKERLLITENEAPDLKLVRS